MLSQILNPCRYNMKPDNLATTWCFGHEPLVRVKDKALRFDENIEALCSDEGLTDSILQPMPYYEKKTIHNTNLQICPKRANP